MTDAPPTTPRFVLGLDLAQASDYSALSVLKVTPPDPAAGEPEALYDLMALARYRGERYPKIVDRVEKIAGSSKLRPPVETPETPAACVDPWGAGLILKMAGKSAVDNAPSKPKLVVDATGVGRAVVDMFLRPSLLDAAELVPLTITAGEAWRKARWGNTRLLAYWVSKRELVSLLVARLQGGRLRFIPGDALSGELEEELRNFRLKLSKANHEQFEAREGKNDDLVLSVAMALWIAEAGVGKKIRVI
jgi:hypothetical protein